MIQKNSSPFFVGGHVSTAGGISNALECVHAIGGNCVQIFSASPRMWKRGEISTAEINRYNELKKQFGILHTVIHAIYLLNLASENSELARKSREVIEFDLNVNAAIGGSGVVVHLGSHLGKGFDAVKDQLVNEIKTVLSNTKNDSWFLIENSAGQNGKLTSDLSEIRWLIDAVGSPRLGWCLDTCHAFANGYMLNNEKLSVESEELIIAKTEQISLFEPRPESVNIFTEIEKYQLWDTLRVVHVNDSRDPFGSGRDRHQNLGDGEIGNDLLGSFLSHEKIRALPLILEVPGLEGKTGPDAANIQRLLKLLQS